MREDIEKKKNSIFKIDSSNLSVIRMIHPSILLLMLKLWEMYTPWHLRNVGYYYLYLLVYDMIESFNIKLEGDLEDHLIQSFQANARSRQDAQVPIQVNLKSIQSWGSHRFPGGDYSNDWLLPLSKIVLLCLVRISTGVSCTHYPWFPCDSLYKGSLHLLWWRLIIIPFKYWNMVINSPLTLLFSRLNNPSSFSLFLYGRLPSPLIVFVTFLWTLSKSCLN